MVRISLFFLLSLFLFFQCGQSPSSSPVRSIPLQRTIRIPAVMTGKSAGRSTVPADSGILALSPGNEDELPEGPNSFDVFNDGWLVINDPLNHRIVIYDSLGKYQYALSVSFAVSSIWLTDKEDLYIEKATTGEIFDIDQQSKVRLVAPHLRDAADQSKSKFFDFNHGEIELPKNRAQGVPTIKVDFQSDSLKMISLYPINLDGSGNAYIVIEAWKPAETLSVVPIIRKYSPLGILSAQICDIPMDYFVFPRDKFREKNGRIYQLLPQKNEICIHIWNTN